MRVGNEDFFHLTYCTNIHPSNGLQEVLTNLRRYAPTLRERLAPDEPFGVGLRLSGRESSELFRGDHLLQLKRLLDRHGLYVFTLNGFPYGPFHRQTVKAAVHAPDWCSEERVGYTLRLAEILAYLLPNGLDGGISTSPLSYKPWVGSGDATLWKHLTRQVVRVVVELIRLRNLRGKYVHLDIEPEPDGLLENSTEVVRFYEDWLLTVGAHELANSESLTIDEARTLLLDHVRICFDTCHMALAYEDPAQVLDRFSKVGIRVGKVQISSALKVVLPTETAQRAGLERSLQPFAESTYLHQIVQRNHDGTLRQYPDLADNLFHIYDVDAEQWRIHFHVPIFVERFGAFHSTQDDIRRVFELLHRRAFSRHLEIETYTWEVLPAKLKLDLLESIYREYAWVRGAFA